MSDVIYLSGSIADLEPHTVKMNYKYQYAPGGIPVEFRMFHIYTPVYRIFELSGFSASTSS